MNDTFSLVGDRTCRCALENPVMRTQTTEERSEPPPALHYVGIVVPARRLEPTLAPLVRELSRSGFGAIIVIDDGIRREDRTEFDALAQIPRVHTLRHAVNQGKGRSLKSGINYFLTARPGFAALLTADADGQHTVTDIIRVANALHVNPGGVVLGARRFTGEVPLRSRSETS